MTEKITKSRFQTLDTMVKRCLIEAGAALEEIRDEKLYLAGGFDSFKNYCESIGKSYHWAWLQIQAGKIQRTLPSVNVPNEATAREIGKIPIPQRRKVVQEALKETKGNLTAPAIKSAVASLPKRSKPAEKEQPKKNQPKDGTGLEIPPEIQEFWNRNDEAQHLLSMISKVKVTLEKAQQSGDKLFKFVDLQGTIARLSMSYEELQGAKSYAVCPSCNGILFKDCPDCRGRGSLPKFNWDMVPEEIRKLRE